MILKEIWKERPVDKYFFFLQARMQTREFSKVEGTELKAKKTEGDLTPKKNEVLGDNKNKGGDVTPKGGGNIDPRDAGMYSPPEADNGGQRDIEPAYSPATS